MHPDLFCYHMVNAGRAVGERPTWEVGTLGEPPPSGAWASRKSRNRCCAPGDPGELSKALRRDVYRSPPDSRC